MNNATVFHPRLSVGRIALTLCPLPSSLLLKTPPYLPQGCGGLPAVGVHKRLYLPVFPGERLSCIACLLRFHCLFFVLMILVFRILRTGRGIRKAQTGVSAMNFY